MSRVLSDSRRTTSMTFTWMHTGFAKAYHNRSPYLILGAGRSHDLPETGHLPDFPCLSSAVTSCTSTNSVQRFIRTKTCKKILDRYSAQAAESGGLKTRRGPTHGG